MIVQFGGWFQSRLASDPDPTDEPRGVSGCTFALPGEPDFDRIIRLQPAGATLRTHGPDLGVKIQAISDAATPEVADMLVGASVELQGDARFVEQNGAVVPRNTAFIDPFDFRISHEGRETILRRKAVWNLDQPETSYYQVQQADIAKRQPQLEVSSSEVLWLSGVMDVQQYWRNRITALDADRTRIMSAKAIDPIEIAGIEQRIENLKLKDWRNQRLHVLLAARAKYKFALQESASTTYITEKLRSSISAEMDWQIEFWMGAWDNDALCGYMHGYLQLRR